MFDHDEPALHITQRRALLAEGISDSAIRHAMAGGDLRRIRRGAYLAANHDKAVPQSGRHPLLVAATAPKLAPDAVISHVSAAALLGLAVWPPPLDRVHISRNGTRGGGRRTRTLHLHISPMTATDVLDVGGMTVTAAARTVVDVARTEPFETGLITADHALHIGMVDRQSLVEVLELQRNLAGTRRAEAVLAFADGLSESVGESRSRVAMLRAGMEIPTLQHRIHGHRGEFLGRVDFAYVDQRIAGEFDGKIKYRSGFVDGADAVDVMVAERRRADAIERAGWRVVRWMWDDISSSTIAGKFGTASSRRA